MANDDITTEVNTEDKIVQELEHEKASKLLGGLKEKSPIADAGTGLNEQLLQMVNRGQFTGMFQGVERCIRVLDKGSNNQRHCMGMVVSNNVHGKHCSACQRIPNSGICNPTVINSSMIRLNDKELKECGLEKDPTYVDPKSKKATVPVPVKRIKSIKVEETVGPRRTKVKTPNSVKLEVTMADLKNDPNVVNVLLQKTLDAIFELPVSNFREAEEIRVVKERVESFLQKGV